MDAKRWAAFRAMSRAFGYQSDKICNVPSASAAASPPDMPPLKLTDAELDAVFNAARPLAQNVREDFLKEVADRLSSYPVVGPGTVHRVCLETQRRFLDRPYLGGPGVSAKSR
jgi:hypothetical protein